MKNRFAKNVQFIKNRSVNFCRDISNYFYRGWQANLTTQYAKAFCRSLIFHVNLFRNYLYSDGIQHHHIGEEQFQRLTSTAKGLHTLLPHDPQWSYSLLIPVQNPRFSQFQECLESALHQSAPHFEILVGLMHPPSQKLKEFLEKKQKENSNLHLFHFFNSKNKEQVINQLVDQAKGHYLSILGEEDWIRPDFLFRCEQTLRIFSNPKKKVIYCNFNAINDAGYFLPNSEHRQPSDLHFPFFFKPLPEYGWLIPTQLWKKSGGLNENYPGAEYEHLLLQLDLAGASFQHLPFSLYSIRQSTKREDKSRESFLQALQDYSKTQTLNWEWGPGYNKECIAAYPPIPTHKIQVVIPYKDQKDLTLTCIHSLLKQKNVQLKITAVDNRSTDLSIAKAIRELGGEVITIDEPFNYSRLNNLAVQRTQQASDCDVLLFLNNDVELEPEAVSEMVRWIDQPSVGMVGCRLHYPDRRLQHGGVEINPHGREEIRWEHIEKFRSFDDMQISKELGFFKAVTAACMMIKRKIFLEVGGFDEIWHPIGYSDTHLATQVEAKGLKCFYTPYAVGVHHESISRKTSIEDFENSWWLHQLLNNEKRR